MIPKAFFAPRLSKLLLSICCFLLSYQINAQRNLIDVPTSEIVEAKKVFFQEQGVFTKKAINTSTIFTFGFGKNFEAGITLNQFVFKRSSRLEVNSEKPEETPDLLINAQKGFEINDWLTAGLGTKSGINTAKTSADFRFSNFSYLNTQFSIQEQKHKIVAGVYYANDTYAGDGSNWGAMAGVDITLVEEKLNFIGDLLSGNNSLSVFNTALEISLPQNWKVALGAQFPFPGSDNDMGGVLQISKN
jgi:hypothetical protein